MGKGRNVFIGPVLDCRIMKVQREVKEMTGKDVSYKEAGEALAVSHPIIVIPQQERKKKKGFGLGLFE